jgi:type IV pilus assembly protein PilB
MSKDALIGDLLVRTGLIDSSGLARAREAQQKHGMSLGKALASLGLAEEEAIWAAIAQTLHLELLTSNKPEVRPEVVALLPGHFCRKRLVVPLSLEGKTLRVAFADPMDTQRRKTWNFAPASKL